MQIEKGMAVAAPAAQVWQMLLDPNVMGGCVPGMQSIEVVSPVEYVSVIAVKIAFISARFKLRTTIVEQRAPHYLRCEGTGEDAGVGSALRQQTELFLEELPDGRTGLRIRVDVDVMGKLGAFGLSVMKTKADRMWEEFGANLVARLEGRAPATTAPQPAATFPTAAVTTAPSLTTAPAAAAASAARGSWWSRLLGRTPARGPDDIYIEIRRGDSVVTVLWPARQADACGRWLQEHLERPA